MMVVSAFLLSKGRSVSVAILFESRLRNHKFLKVTEAAKFMVCLGAHFLGNLDSV